jgi:N-acetylneuraminic acid mutarotase
MYSLPLFLKCEKVIPDKNVCAEGSMKYMRTVLIITIAILVASVIFIFVGCGSPTTNAVSTVQSGGDTTTPTVSPTTSPTASPGWTELQPANPPAARIGHAAATIANSIYIFGGDTGAASVSTRGSRQSNDLWICEASDPNSVTYSQVTAVNSPPPGRSGASAVQYKGNYFIFGGRDESFDPLNDLWRFDPASSEWTKLNPTGDTPQPRDAHAAAVVGENMVIIGGDGDTGPLVSVYVYNFTTNHWVKGANFTGNSSLLYTPVTSVHGDEVHVMGTTGSTVYVYNVVDAQWTSRAISGDAPTPREQAQFAQVGRSTYIFGGVTPESVILDDVWKYSPGATQVFTSVSPRMPVTLMGGMAAPVPVDPNSVIDQNSPNRVIIFGGCTGNDYIPNNRTFQFVPAPDDGR